MSKQQNRWRQVGERIVTRRSTELGMSQADLVRASGVNDRTIRQLETGEPVNYRTDTRRAVEKALRWEPLSIDKILAGLEPVEVTMPPGLDIADIVTKFQAGQTTLAETVERIERRTRSLAERIADRCDKRGQVFVKAWTSSQDTNQRHEKRVVPAGPTRRPCRIVPAHSVS